MGNLTTRQRDILRILLETSKPLGTAEIATTLNLSPRQVNYSLKGINSWLAQQQISLKVTPGVGVELECAPEQTRLLQKEISSKSSLQLVLTAGQRQQLLSLILLTANEPLILDQIRALTQISRATILKDLDDIETWLGEWGIKLVRKPNFGVQVEASELTCQQALAALIWGETPFGQSLTTMTHNAGLIFSLKADANLLPIVQRANQILGGWKIQRVTGLVAYAEEQLGGRYTDDAVLHLSLALAILNVRVQSGHHLDVQDNHLDWLRLNPIWPVANTISKRIGWPQNGEWRDADIAGIAMQLMAASRSEGWLSDMDRDFSATRLIDRLIEHICQAYNHHELSEDRTLRDGLVNHVIPACLRQRFHLWFPSTLTRPILPAEFEFEYRVAKGLADIVKEQTGYDLPPYETSNLAMLVRAAIIRIGPHRLRRVVVVCPSGMATAQLLVARLETRFPSLCNLKVISLRQLDPETVSTADLILTTVPLPNIFPETCFVLQVHPLLMPNDIETITQFLGYEYSEERDAPDSYHKQITPRPPFLGHST